VRPNPFQYKGRNRNADRLLIVDCLLPGQVRKLGQNFTYLTPCRPVKTPASDCEIRGGEYTAYDRANYATALKVWLPQAQEGDPAAQTYVGEIYEKGLGTLSDYVLAAQWYRKAAEQGYARAKINLGFLYENGWGVEKSLLTALNWYREASGLSGGELEFASSVEIASRETQKRELTALKQEVKEKTGQIKALQEKLSQTQQELAHRKATLNGMLEEVKQLEQQLAKQKQVSKADATIETQEQALRQQEAELTRQRQEVVRLEAETLERQARLNQELETTRRERQTVFTQLESQKQEENALRQQLKQAQAQLEHRRSELERAQQELAATQAEIKQRKQATEAPDKAGEIQRLVQKLEDHEAMIVAQREEMAGLESKIQEQEAQLTQQLKAVQPQEHKLQTALDARNREVALLQSELAQAQEQLSELRQELAAREAAVAVERDQWAKERQRLLQQAAAAQTKAQLKAGAPQQQAKLTSELENARRQRQLLLEEVERQKQAAASLGWQLDEAQQQMERRRSALGVAQQELEATRTQLEQLRQASGAAENAEIARLEKNLKDREATLATQHQEIAWLESEMREHQAQMTRELKLAKQQEQQMQAALVARNQEVNSLKEQLTQTQGQLSQARQQLADQETKAAAQVKVQGQLKDLEQRLHQREADVARQQQEIARLEAKLEGEQTQIAVLEENENVKLAGTLQNVGTTAGGPTIEIIDPPLSITRDISLPTVTLRSPVEELEVIGKALPVRGLMTLRVNDRPQQMDDNGIFRVPVPVQRPDTPVSVVAIDKQGRRTAVDFVVIPKLAQIQQKESKIASPRPSMSQDNLNFGAYHALVIGNNQYRHLPNLSTAVNDAQAVDKVLREKYGFQTKVLLNVDRYTILTALNEYREKLTENDNFLLYYAGHGELDKTNLHGSWLPIDTETENTANWISNVAITDILNVMPAKHVLIVADSCYSGTMTRTALTRQQPGMPEEIRLKWLQIMAKTRSRIALTSGGFKPVLDIGGGDHSLFAKAFLEVLNGNNDVLEGYRLYRQVFDRVKKAAQALRIDQDPQYIPIKYAGHESGEFIFLPSAVLASSDTPIPETPVVKSFFGW
jgi:Caspase domain./Sel1 repeat.